MPGGLSRVHFTVGDVREEPLPEAHFDLIVTNFLLDYFPADQLASVVRRIAVATSPNALWVVRDFQQPARGSRKVVTRLALAGMYAFLRFVTGIPVRMLVDSAPFIGASGLIQVSRRQRLGGFLVATLWRRG